MCTPPLDRGDILPGVTRQSILELTRSESWGGEQLDVVERSPTMPEICEAAESGRSVVPMTRYFVFRHHIYFWDSL